MSCPIQLQYLVHGPLELNYPLRPCHQATASLSLSLCLSLSIKRLSLLYSRSCSFSSRISPPAVPVTLALSLHDSHTKALIQQAPPSGIQSCQFHVARSSSTDQGSPSHHQKANQPLATSSLVLAFSLGLFISLSILLLLLSAMLVSLTVGKVDAGVTVLLTPDKRLVCLASWPVLF